MHFERHVDILPFASEFAQDVSFREESSSISSTPLLNVVLGLGGNIGDTFAILKKAVGLLESNRNIFNFKKSRIYNTAPHECNEQARYLNLCVCFDTNYSIKELFDLTESLEKELGKVEKPKNAPRLIDIDHLFYGGKIFNTHKLTIPHPRWQDRLFVLYPLADLFEKAPIDDQLLLLERINAFSESERREIIALE